MLEMTLTLMHGVVQHYVPPSFRRELRIIIFNKCTHLLGLSSDNSQRHILINNLITNADSESAYEELRKLFEGSSEFSNTITLTNENKWDIIIRLHDFAKFTETQRKIYKDFMQFNDHSETRKKKIMILDVLTQKFEETSETYDSLLQQKRKYSYVEMGLILEAMSQKSKDEELIAYMKKNYFDSTLLLI